MTSLQRLRKTTLVAFGVVTPIWAFIEYSKHDQRELSKNEVNEARMSLARLSAKSKQEHMTNLSQYGATIVEGSLSNPQKVKEWNKTLIHAFGNDNLREARSIVSTMRGRMHCDVTNKKSTYHADFARIGGQGSNGKKLTNDEMNDSDNENILPQIAQAYFAQRGISPRRYKLTQLQFLNAKSGSENQIWHRDNTRPGLTVLLALCDVTDNGPTELILKSHLESESLWDALKREAMDAYNAKRSGNLSENGKDNDTKDVLSGQPLLACLKTGDAVLYDSRVLHRGRGFTSSGGKKGGKGKKQIESLEIDRPVLVLRWDALETPPPGAGLIVTSANDYSGSFRTATMFWISKALELI